MNGGPQTAGAEASWGQLRRADHLDPAEVPEVLTLARAAADADGAAALSEATLLQLRAATGASLVHFSAREPGGRLVGYAQLDPGNGTVEATIEAVVHPLHRRRGIGRALLAAATDAAVGRPIRAWAHGEHPSAAALALDLGFDRARVLWQLRRPLRPPLPDVALPDGVSLRPFRPGADDAAWVELNRRAFADHPEQGRWTLDDLRVRMAEPWFDPAGFLLAVEAGSDRLLGFHWTKVHRGSGQAQDEPAQDEPVGDSARPIGEVYVLGVDPTTHGRGLGRALAAAGLRHLHDRGLDRVMLYVDESNRAAMGLYARLGFQRWTAHVQYRRPATVEGA